MKLNYGCGEVSLEGYINVDSIKTKDTKPDILADIKKGHLPFKDDEFEEVCALHVIEHIERGWWQRLFEEFHRILKFDGMLILAYPEFERCAKNFIENYKGARDYWRMTLYGRQNWPGDYHIVPMRTIEVVDMLYNYGFYDIKYQEEIDQEWNTFLVCKRGNHVINREELYKQELFKS